MNVLACSYNASDNAMWDGLCAVSLQGTFLHSRAFLSYHGHRFDDCSVVLTNSAGEWLGVMPAAWHPKNSGVAVSHPGLSYGGIVHGGALRGARMVEALEAISVHLARLGGHQLLYKAVPSFYHRAPAQDDLYALFRLGARRSRCDLTSTIALTQPRQASSRRLRNLKKARGAGLSIDTSWSRMAEFHAILCSNLTSKHGVLPVHTSAELEQLRGLVPGHLELVTALSAGVVVAGVLLFLTGTTAHAQYIASSEAGQAGGALDLVFAHCIEAATAAGRAWFDFGICTEEQGKVLNEGLLAFKNEFGGGGHVHEFYELNLGERDVIE